MMPLLNVCIWVKIIPPRTSPMLVCVVYNPDGKNNVYI